ncbi:hypothetical protein GCM10010187_19540 [Actinomadura coerulea]|nr:hypothetical protein GCM10010187_19540 [Actinomadura coerulea]
MHEFVTARSRTGDAKIDKCAGRARVPDGASGSRRAFMTISGSPSRVPAAGTPAAARVPDEVPPRVFISLRFVEYGAYWSSPD